MRLGLGIGMGEIGVPSVGIPLSLNPTLWLRSDLGITLNGSNVSAWADQSGSGSGGSVSQGTGASQPAYNASDAKLNSLPSITLVGPSKPLVSAAGFTVAQPNTIFVVAYSAAGTNGDYFDGGITRQTFGRNATVWQIFAGGSVITGGPADANAHCFCGVFNGASSALYVDNSSTANASGNIGANSLVELSIPGVAGSTSAAIAEMIIVSGALAQSVRLQVFQYLGTRYNITVS